MTKQEFLENLKIELFKVSNNIEWSTKTILNSRIKEDGKWFVYYLKNGEIGFIYNDNGSMYTRDIKILIQRLI